MVLVEREWSDSTMFMIELQDIPQKIADDIVRPVQTLFPEDRIVISYRGNVEKGDLELNMIRLQGSRHDITKLCACVYQTLDTPRMKAELSDNPTYVIFDNEFPYELFNCIAQRLRMIESARKNHADASICATCGNCHLPRLSIDRCNMWSRFNVNISTAFNRELLGIDLDDLGEGIKFSSPKAMTCEFSNLDNFMHMLTIEQLIDVHKLI